MSTEYEGNEVPPAPSAPPGPADASRPSEPQQDAARAASLTKPEPVPERPADPAPAQVAPQPGAPAAEQAPAVAPAAPVPVASDAHVPPVPQTPPPGGWPPPPPQIPAYAGAGGGPVYPGGGGDGSGGGGGGGQDGPWGASYQSPPPGRPGGGRKGGLVAAVIVAALVAGGVGGGVGYWAAERDDDGVGSTTVAAADSPAAAKRDPASVAGIAQKALPSVVTIDAQGGNGEGSTGTGFVYDKEGHILTNNHVVASAAEGGKLSATFSNGKKYDAEVIGRAQGYDVAVIKLKNASGLKPLALGDSDKTAVGDATIAIGAPFGLSNTVTTGIVSAKDRPVASSDGESAKSSYMSALQTDASINPGNSGGPLLDAHGAVIGINSAIQPGSSGGGLGGGSSQGGSIGLGFAIPVNQAKRVAQELIRTGTPVYPVIGATVSLEEGTDGATIADQGPNGSAAVTSGGPAADAGLKSGDTITKLDDTIVDSGPTLIGEIWTHQPGDKVQLTYKRGGKQHTVEVTLGQRKGDD